MKATDSDRFVVDASVALSWCLKEDKSAFGEWILDRLSEGACAVVPSLWFFETTNTLLVAERRKRISPAQSAAFLESLASFNIEIDNISLPRVFDRVMSEARGWGLTAYDTAYLELASRLGLPLATLDDALKKAAKSVGIALLRHSH